MLMCTLVNINNNPNVVTIPITCFRNICDNIITYHYFCFSFSLGFLTWRSTMRRCLICLPHSLRHLHKRRRIRVTWLWWRTSMDIMSRDSLSIWHKQKRMHSICSLRYNMCVLLQKTAQLKIFQRKLIAGNYIQIINYFFFFSSSSSSSFEYELSFFCKSY